MFRRGSSRLSQSHKSPTGPDQHRAAARARLSLSRRLSPLLPVDSPEYGELVADLQEYGLLQPIVLYDGRILDGRDRTCAWQHRGVDRRPVEWSSESRIAACRRRREPGG